MGIILDSGIAFCHFTRGDLHYQKGEYSRAIEDLSRGLQLRPGTPLALSQRARAYEHVGDRDKALLDYEAAMEIMKLEKSRRGHRKAPPPGADLEAPNR